MGGENEAGADLLDEALLEATNNDQVDIALETAPGARETEREVKNGEDKSHSADRPRSKSKDRVDDRKAERSKSRDDRKAKKSKSREGGKAKKSKSREGGKAKKSKSREGGKAKKSKSREGGKAKKSKSREGGKAKRSKSREDRKAKRSKSRNERKRSKSRDARKDKRSKSRAKSRDRKKDDRRRSRSRRRSPSKRRRSHSRKRRSPSKKRRRSLSKRRKSPSKRHKSPSKRRRSRSRRRSPSKRRRSPSQRQKSPADDAKPRVDATEPADSTLVAAAPAATSAATAAAELAAEEVTASLRRKSKWDEAPPPNPEMNMQMAVPQPPPALDLSQSTRHKVIKLEGMQIRCLIGKGGETIKGIRAESGASVQIEHTPGDAQGTVTINGDVERTEKMIQDLLMSKGCPLGPKAPPPPPPPGMAPPMLLPPPPGLPPGMAPGMAAAEMENLEVIVPPELASLLIGPGGSHLRDVRAQAGSNVFISLLPSVVPGGPHQVRITGDDCNLAAALIRVKIKALQRRNADLQASGLRPLAPGLSQDVAALTQAQALLKGRPVARSLPGLNPSGAPPSSLPPFLQPPSVLHQQAAPNAGIPGMHLPQPQLLGAPGALHGGAQQAPPHGLAQFGGTLPGAAGSPPGMAIPARAPAPPAMADAAAAAAEAATAAAGGDWLAQAAAAAAAKMQVRDGGDPTAAAMQAGGVGLLMANSQKGTSL